MARKVHARETTDTDHERRRDHRYVRGDDTGRSNDSDDMGRAHGQDRRRKQKKATRPGFRDRDDPDR
jgi:hypothetical protein